MMNYKTKFIVSLLLIMCVALLSCKANSKSCIVEKLSKNAKVVPCGYFVVKYGEEYKVIFFHDSVNAFECDEGVFLLSMKDRKSRVDFNLRKKNGFFIEKSGAVISRELSPVWMKKLRQSNYMQLFGREQVSDLGGVKRILEKGDPKEKSKINE